MTEDDRVGCVPRSRRVLPLPNLPQTRLNSPLGKTIFRSVNMNFVFGVAEALDTALALAVPERARSCGQVTVALWNAIGGGFSPSGGTAATSADWRYFSMRRRETKDCKGLSQTHAYDFAGTYLKHIDQSFGKGVQCEFHFGEDYQIRLALDSLGIVPKTHQQPTVAILSIRCVP